MAHELGAAAFAAVSRGAATGFDALRWLFLRSTHVVLKEEATRPRAGPPPVKRGPRAAMDAPPRRRRAGRGALVDALVPLSVNAREHVLGTGLGHGDSSRAMSFRALGCAA